MPRAANQSDPLVIRMLRDYRLSLIAREDEQIKRLAADWINIENSLLDEMQLLAFQIQNEQAKGSAITEQLIARMDRYKKLDAQMKQRILEFTKKTVVPDVEYEQQEFGNAAIDIANDVINSQFRLKPSFDRLPYNHVETYVGYLGNGAPLNTLLKEAYPDALDGVIKALLQGTAKGLNPNQIAAAMAKGMGMGLERITLIARTEQLRVNRAVSADQYRNSGLQGVMKRVATKDNRVCMACLVSDGEIIPLSQELDDHPRGRCCAIFQIKGVKEIQWEKGPDWFNKQSEDIQMEMMGADKFAAWKDGKFKLSDLRQNAYSDIWGQSPRVASLKELLDGDYVPVKINKKVFIPAAPKVEPKKIIQGTSISEALEMKVTDKKIKAEMKIVMDAINRVHRINAMPKIPVVTSTSKKFYGKFFHTFAGTPLNITISKKGAHHAMTIAHEIGHFLDYSLVPGRHWSSKSNEEFGTILAAIRKTNWYKNFWRNYLQVNSNLEGWRISKKYANYIYEPIEMLARAYAQYIAVQSGDPEMASQLKKMMEQKLQTQWERDDFEPVLEAFNTFFRSKGLLNE